MQHSLGKGVLLETGQWKYQFTKSKIQNPKSQNPFYRIENKTQFVFEIKMEIVRLSL